jgi:hypothetical protein
MPFPGHVARGSVRAAWTFALVAKADSRDVITALREIDDDAEPS